MKNALIIDVEEWYHVNYPGIIFEEYESISTVHENITRIIQILREREIKATFFVLGCVAEREPQLVELIDMEGHEIASHSYSHRPLYEMKPGQFKEELRQSVETLEDITGKKVLGFRAPSWSITEKSMWALDILAEEGIVYDSSICPFKTYMYGIEGGRKDPHTIVTKSGARILELPPPTIRILGQTLIVGGGFYLRILPYWLTRRALKKLNARGKTAQIYIHPRELDEVQHRLKLKFRDTLIQYYNVGSVRGKVMRLLRDFDLAPIKDAYGIS